jgi:hypothetical protein
MNRFAFPYEWMIENWPRSATTGVAAASAITIEPIPRQSASPRMPSGGIIEIMLAGATVHVPSGIDGTWLAEVMRAVRGSAPRLA